MLLDHRAKLVRFLSTNTGSHLAGWSVAALTDIGYHDDLASLDGGAGKNDLSEGVDLAAKYDPNGTETLIYDLTDLTGFFA